VKTYDISKYFERYQLGERDLKVLFTIADHYEKLGEFSKSIKYYYEAVEIEPEYELASKSLFHALWDLDRTDEAFEEVQRFVKVTGSEAYSEIISDIIKDNEENP